MTAEKPYSWERTTRLVGAHKQVEICAALFRHGERIGTIFNLDVAERIVRALNLEAQGEVGKC